MRPSLWLPLALARLIYSSISVRTALTTFTTSPGAWVTYTDPSSSAWTAQAPSVVSTVSTEQGFASFTDTLVIVAETQDVSSTIQGGGGGAASTQTVGDTGASGSLTTGSSSTDSDFSASNSSTYESSMTGVSTGGASATAVSTSNSSTDGVSTVNVTSTITSVVYSYYTSGQIVSTTDSDGSIVELTASGTGVVDTQVTDAAGETIPVVYGVTTGTAPTGSFTTDLPEANAEATGTTSNVVPLQTGLSSGSGATTSVTISSPSYPGYCLAVSTLLQGADGNYYNKLNDTTPVKLLACDSTNPGQYWMLDSALAAGTPGYTTNVALNPFTRWAVCSISAVPTALNFEHPQYPVNYCGICPHSGVNYCMDATQSDPDDSTPVQVWECACSMEEWSGTSGQSCSNPILAQQWTFAAVTYQGASAYNIMLNVGGTAVTTDRQFGVCLDVTDSNTDDALQSWSCNDPNDPNGNQVWTFGTDSPFTGTA